MSEAARLPYQYVVLRCVPRADREEFLNVGVVLYCQARDFLSAAWHLDADRLRALDPSLDLRQLRGGLEFVSAACDGSGAAGLGEASLGVRFGFVRAPRSTVLQPGPVHGGRTDDPARALEHLLATLVG